MTGTGTDIGKTVVTTLLADFLSVNGRRIFPYKPIQTGAEKEDGRLLAPDPEIYKFLDLEHPDKHYTYLLETPSSPHLAATKENIVYDFAKIYAHINALQNQYDGIVAEGAGGLYVPITEEGYCMIDLMKELSFPVILVAEAGLGTINHTVLSIKALEACEIPIAGIILNGTGREGRSLELDNRKMIERLTELSIAGTVPFEADIKQQLKRNESRAKLTKDWNRKIIEG